MNLTYEIINSGKGYFIKNNGVNWIKQDVYIPYPAETIEQAAKNHIEVILADQQAQQDQLTEIEQLKVRLQATEEALLQLILEGGGM